jgi:hypothetical protein
VDVCSLETGKWTAVCSVHRLTDETDVSPSTRHVIACQEIEE